MSVPLTPGTLGTPASPVALARRLTSTALCARCRSSTFVYSTGPLARARALFVVLSLLVGGCGTATSSSRLASLFEGERAEAAREAAPELFARAEAARDRATVADLAGDEAAREDHITAARLWLSAAVVEADADAVAAERDREQVRATEAEALATERETLRARIVETEARERAAAVARAEASRAFEHAAGYESRRLRRANGETRQLWRVTTRALLRRVTLLTAGAELLGAPAERVAALRERRDALFSEREPERVVGEANTLVRDAAMLLGHARAAAPGPTEAERVALREAARARGYRVERSERGLEVRHPSFTNLGESGAVTLAGLVAAHPHGAVMVVAADRREANARAVAGRLRQRLARAGVPEDRMRHVGVIGSEGIVLVFLSY